MAKLGIALGSGPRGLGFESRHSDQRKQYRKQLFCGTFSLFIGKLITFFESLRFPRFLCKSQKVNKKVNNGRFFSSKNGLQEAQKNRPADNWTAFPKGETHVPNALCKYLF